MLREKLIELNGNGHDVDAIVQVGTNLSMVRLAAAAELWLGKPVIAINTATYWHALRQNKIMDKIAGARPLAGGLLKNKSKCPVSDIRVRSRKCWPGHIGAARTPL